MLEDIEWANGMDARTADRFWSKVDASGDCWLWTAGGDGKGYGRFAVAWRPSVVVNAHRFAYESLVGSIPEGMVIDHLCRVRRCVNPDHLDVTSVGENVARGISRYYCRRGHRRVGDNVRGRTCVECRRLARGHKNASLVCRRGHERAIYGWHVYPSGKRCCAECHRLANERKNARRRARRQDATPGT